MALHLGVFLMRRASVIGDLHVVTGHIVICQLLEW